MVKTFTKLALVFLFAAAMGYLEASVVVYLLKIINLQGFSSVLHPLPFMPSLDAHIYWIEILREAATIIMLFSLAMICASSFNGRLYYFMSSFAVWDIFYYIFLRLTTGWPESILDTDILFSIPVPWVGPVLAPVLISISMIFISAFMLKRIENRRHIPLKMTNWLLIGLGSIIIIVFTFMTGYKIVHGEIMPGPYRWWLFAPGFILFNLGFFVNKKRKKKKIRG